MSVRLVILDRDGVINRDSDAYIKSPDEWAPISGSPQAIARLNNAGWTVTVATNQSGIGRGLFDHDQLALIHQKMSQELATAGARIEAIAYCPHRPNKGCTCRKPRTGLLESLARRFGVSLVDVPVIGDALRDVQAALAVGARPILVKTGKGERTLDTHSVELHNIEQFPDLFTAVDALLSER
ncbi:D-glycero-beta-D-manno-heptose 1,7-bisphosphate 7-phosphatase [Rhabdochromatium marinum]|uniref:D-glycero-beta-D-manno-heptose 1,7-bisphosphate 7-phosphatase n=1 Tax=Rhabdochromatium marinum TaxID=48729 RepID=UPI0019038029|nr:D-glycero-beta-D-manno-heptose 1,7-bisphosphate 7-phosphatase [Rhabdochromatium marinum]MBK1647476.1 D-glycero-beta-D-manno-heptose-1,7-bisphosphate 7-phosphatase [Rhabdochromatium marinum]